MIAASGSSKVNWKVDSCCIQLAVKVVLLVLLGLLWAWLNGHGIGRAGRVKWTPVGTLAANVSPATVMAALATVKKSVIA
ncbi:fluoride export protein 2-like isoform X1 [Sesbania bispinosa]|nr:fluoride export protein 2-like isoform X1 [Sesbania bispinosa]